MGTASDVLLSRTTFIAEEEDTRDAQSGGAFPRSAQGGHAANGARSDGGGALGAGGAPATITAETEEVIYSSAQTTVALPSLQRHSVGRFFQAFAPSLPWPGRGAKAEPRHDQPALNVGSVKSPAKGMMGKLFSRPRQHVGVRLAFSPAMMQITPTYAPASPLLLPPTIHLSKKITLVLDLDETLVHSSFMPLPTYDFTINVELAGAVQPVFVKKRPGLNDFLRAVADWFEVVMFTASLPVYANPVCDRLSAGRGVCFHHRLYREDCVQLGAYYVKDLSRLGRDLSRVIIVDNSEISFCLQPENAVHVPDFVSNSRDRVLKRLTRLLHRVKCRDRPDVRLSAVQIPSRTTSLPS